MKDSAEIDVYIGRGRSGESHMLNTSVGERGWLGNPFHVKLLGRDTVIKYYRRIFEWRLVADEEFRQAVENLAGTNLGCFCQQLDENEPRCHGEVIAEYADKFASK